MADSPGDTYYRPSKGTLSGFDQVTTPTGNPNIVTEGWSIEQLRRFLTNQDGVNFASPEELLRIQNEFIAHEEDYDNPHRTTLSQIVGDIVGKAIGAILPGTTPNEPPFFAIDAAAGLPFNGVVPASYSHSNMYRMTPGGWFKDVATDASAIGTDYVGNRPGIPLFSSLQNIVPDTWYSDVQARLNTIISPTSITTLNYPFAFYDVKETPAITNFGCDILMTQDLLVNYTTTFFILPSTAFGSVRIYQPSDQSNYVEVSLTDGMTTVYSDVMTATSVRYSNGVIRVSVNFTSYNPVADNKLRLVHVADGDTNPQRQGALDRVIFSIAKPLTTRGGLNFPVLKDGNTPAAMSPITANLTTLGAPTTLSNFTLTMAVTMYPINNLASFSDSTLLVLGGLVISRDQTQVRVSVNGTTLFTSTLLDGFNAFTVSYSGGKIIFKDLANDRQVQTGTFAPLPTTALTVGPMGGYLHHLYIYAQSDDSAVVENLTNG